MNVVRLSRTTLKALERLDALAKSLRELNLRRDARCIGIGYYVRAKMADPRFEPSSHAAWQPLPKRTRRLFENLLKRRRTT